MSDKKRMNLEQKIAELEKLATEIEKNDIPLDEALAVFEKSISLASECIEKLNDQSGKLQELTEEAKRLCNED